jgi:hypothetical protein
MKKPPPQLEGRIVLLEDERPRADSTGIALQACGAVLVFGALCVFGWPALLVLVPIMLLGRLL